MRSGISGPSHSSLLAGRALDDPIAADDPERAMNWRLLPQSSTDVTSMQTGQMPVLQDWS
jgi:hypothetical protein